MGRAKFDPGYEELRPWNAGLLVGAKRPLQQKHVWQIRFFLEREERLRDLALFNLAIDSKLRGCDVVAMRITDIVAPRKVGRPVRFELMEATGKNLDNWLQRRGRRARRVPSQVFELQELASRALVDTHICLAMPQMAHGHVPLGVNGAKGLRPLHGRVFRRQRADQSHRWRYRRQPS